MLGAVQGVISELSKVSEGKTERRWVKEVVMVSGQDGSVGLCCLNIHVHPSDPEGWFRRIPSPYFQFRNQQVWGGS